MTSAIRSRFLLAMLAIGLLAAGPSSAAAGNAKGTNKVDVIVVYKAMPDQAEKDRARGLGAQVRRDFDNLPMRALSIPEHALERLGKGKGVSFVAPDRPTSSLMSAARATANAPDSNSYAAKFTGYRVGVAIVDTGVGLHTDLSSSIRQYDFLNGAYPRPEIDDGALDKYNSDDRSDPFGHGTHVAGILSGDGSASNNLHLGQATSARLLSLRVLDGNGRGVTSDTIAALDWLLSYGRYFDIEVVNLSIGKAVEESNATDPLVLAVERVWDDGIVVVVAAGNHGRDGHMTVTSPANSRKVITVGSLTDSGTASDFTDDYVSTYSSQGPTLGDHVLKPDLVAPGNRVTAAMSAGAKLMDNLPNRIAKCGDDDYCSANYLELSGTSMAAPLVAATAAMMLEKDSTLTPATVKARLMRSARKIDADATASGAGVLDITAALNETGVVYGEALSPLMARSEEGPVILVEDTAKLWGDETWGAGFIWTDGYMWTDGFMWTDGYVWTDGYMWTDGFVWTDAYIWTDGFLWTDSFMWTDGFMWTDAVTDYSPLYDTATGSIALDDD